MDDVRTLFIGRRRVLQIERDVKYAHMWRVRLPDGSLSDMTNIDRAKDAALEIAEGIEARKNRHKSPLKSLTNFSWSRPPVKRLQNSVPQPSESLENVPATKSAETSPPVVPHNGNRPRVLVH